MKRWRRRLRAMTGSVRVRVTAVAALTFAVALTVGAVVLMHALESRLVGDVRRADEAALERQAVHVLTAGIPRPDGSETAAPIAGAGTVAYRIAGPGDQVMIATANGSLIGGQGAGVTFTPTSPSFFDTIVEDPTGVFTAKTTEPLDTRSLQLLGVAGHPGPFLVSTVEVFPGLSLSTASSLAGVEHTLSTTRMVLWYAVPALILLVAGLAWLLVGRALRPVHALTHRAASISADSLHERVPVPVVNDEVAELATTINGMLDRIETADIAGRRLVSDASHELRTPIAVIRTELEVARRDPEAAWEAVASTVLGEVDRLQSLVDDLLLLARINERGIASERFAVLDVIRDVAGRRREVPVTTAVVDAAGDWADAPAAAPVLIVGDGQAVQRALDHVVANAARHAASRVEIVVDHAGLPGMIAIHVDDDGPGIAPADRERVLQRFERLDQARDRDAGGSGLGLAVAADVAAAHGGTVRIDDSPLGGARVTLTLRHNG